MPTWQLTAIPPGFHFDNLCITVNTSVKHLHQIGKRGSKHTCHNITGIFLTADTSYVMHNFLSVGNDDDDHVYM